MIEWSTILELEVELHYSHQITWLLADLIPLDLGLDCSIIPEETTIIMQVLVAPTVAILMQLMEIKAIHSRAKEEGSIHQQLDQLN